MQLHQRASQVVSSLPAKALLPCSAPGKPARPITSVLESDNAQEYAQAEESFRMLLTADNLDVQLKSSKPLQEAAEVVQSAVAAAVSKCYSSGQPGDSMIGNRDHLFLQRLLYRINRLVLFWYDDLHNYSNERSIFLAQLRDSIEAPWQQWEFNFVDVGAYKRLCPDEIKEALRRQAAEDVDPPLSEGAAYMQNEMTREGYRHLLAVASVDGLVEASRQSRVCGGAANEVMCAIFRVLMEEYGVGRFNKKHSTFFATMMRELDLSTEPEFYFDLVPWQSLASINHNFLLTERRRHYLRYAAGLTFFEVNGPSVYRTYLAAANRVGLSADASGYWELHIKEDERHGRQMVEDVALPLVDRYNADAWELLLGYDQEKLMGQRAGDAVVAQIKAVDQGKRGATDPVV
ncbi:hypothetical protein WJX72_010607 [[Myrmecia] bisecta]|uniref:Iron-containing redox enzyme family protein n=1 Tax=[Myrmecia] bisecta TaxID=41462 RepID=A0AAW1QGC7_9CHLO